jgi:hypothetical protein
MTMARFGGLSVPASGGGWFRQFPYSVTHRAFAQKTAARTPGIFYIHPWEIDPGQPRMSVPLVTRLRHYRGLGRTRARLERLFSEFRFTSISRGLDSSNNSSAAGAA